MKPASMMRIGAHMSVAGSLAHAIERARLHACESLQIFTKNASQWRGRPLDAEAVGTFRRAAAASGLSPIVSHASYLINMATAVPALREQSIEALTDELTRAETLGLSAVVIHPGTCTSGSEDDALMLVAGAIGEAFRRCGPLRLQLLLEHTAGQGRTIGHRFEHLAGILARLDGHPQVGICLDTCHLLAAGYDIATPDGYEATCEAFDRLIGFGRLGLVHANDSKKPCGSRVDRHAHVGEGCLGEAPFARILQDRRFAGRALIIETAKAATSTRPGAIVIDEFDVKNLTALRRLRADAERTLTASQGSTATS
jgi:deoxyribonuclease-4